MFNTFKIILSNLIQLLGNLSKWSVQIKRFHTDSVSMHHKLVIRLYLFLCLCIQNCTRHLMRLIFE